MMKKKELESLSMLRKLPLNELKSIEEYAQEIVNLHKTLDRSVWKASLVGGTLESMRKLREKFDRLEHLLINPLTIIAAINNDGIIGIDGHLAYHIKADTVFFRKMTTGRIVVMGRKTFDSMGKVPLKNRLNIVVTTSTDPEIIPKEYRDEVLVVHSLFDVVFRPRLLKLMREKFGHIYDDSGTMLIGGAELYRLALEENQVYHAILTHINDSKEELKSGLKFPRLSWIFPDTLDAEFIEEHSLEQEDLTDTYPLKFKFYTKIHDLHVYGLMELNPIIEKILQYESIKSVESIMNPEL